MFFFPLAVWKVSVLLIDSFFPTPLIKFEQFPSASEALLILGQKTLERIQMNIQYEALNIVFFLLCSLYLLSLLKLWKSPQSLWDKFDFKLISWWSKAWQVMINYSFVVEVDPACFLCLIHGKVLTLTDAITQWPGNSKWKFPLYFGTLGDQGEFIPYTKNTPFKRFVNACCMLLAVLC